MGVQDAAARTRVRAGSVPHDAPDTEQTADLLAAVAPIRRANGQSGAKGARAALAADCPARGVSGPAIAGSCKWCIAPASNLSLAH